MGLKSNETGSNQEKANKITENLNEDEYEIYEPMLEGLRVDDRLSIYYNLIFLVRRIIFVITIFFLVEKN